MRGDSTCWGQTPEITCPCPRWGRRASSSCLLGTQRGAGWSPAGRCLWQGGWNLHVSGVSGCARAHTHTMFLGKVPTANAGRRCGAHHLQHSTGSSKEIRSQIKRGLIKRFYFHKKKPKNQPKPIYTSFKKGQGEPKSKNRKEQRGTGLLKHRTLLLHINSVKNQKKWGCRQKPAAATPQQAELESGSRATWTAAAGVPHPFFSLWWVITGIISFIRRKPKQMSCSQPTPPPSPAVPTHPSQGEPQQEVLGWPSALPRDAGWEGRSVGSGRLSCTEQEVEGDAMVAGTGEPRSSSCAAPRMGLRLPLRPGSQSLLCKGSLSAPLAGAPQDPVHGLQLVDTDSFAPLEAEE